MEESDEIVDLETEEFHGFIQRHLVCMILFFFLYSMSYVIIKYVKIRPDNDDLYAGDEDYFVYRISTWICSNSMSISIGAVTLLPFSVIGAEILQRYPQNYYLKWLNFSLINTLWNYVFLLSNLSLFVLLPFSYFFIESQGFSMNFHLQTLSGSVRRPLLARFYETMIVCALVIVILIGIADTFYSHLFSQPSYIWLSMICFSSLSTPLLYSFASLIGVILLLLSVPFGFAKMFDICSGMLVQQEEMWKMGSTKNKNANSLPFSTLTAEKLQEMSNNRQQNKLKKFNTTMRLCGMEKLANEQQNGGGMPAKISKMRRNGGQSSSTIIFGGIHRIIFNNQLKNSFEKCKHFVDLLLYPLIMLILFILTALSILMVTINALQLLFGFRDLPAYVQYLEEYRHHTLGPFGAIIEVIIILYMMMSSLVGVYSIPFIWRIRPQKGKTSMTSIIVNCMMISILSSALPVLVRTLGITTFDLLGEFGRINWISNLSLVLSYNILFAVVSIYCIVYKFTEPVRRELLHRFYSLTKKSTLEGGGTDYLDGCSSTNCAKKED